MLPTLPVLLFVAVASVAPPHHAPHATHVPRTAPSPTSVVTVHALDFAYTAPSSVPAGTITFRLVNDGKELHHLSIVRLTEGKTAADFMAALHTPGPPPKWMVFVGGPNAAAPGAQVEATMTLEPGHYLFTCFIPSPGDDPTPHLMKGMVRDFTVTPSGAASSEPRPDVHVAMSDYAFTFSTPLTTGPHQLRVTNDAAQAHELIFVQLGPGATTAGVAQWIEAGMKGPPPGMPIGGATAIDPGRSVIIPVNLAPGRYGLICFAPDIKDGKPHSAHGMIQDFTISAR